MPCWLLAALLFVAAANLHSEEPPSQIRFQDVTSDSGINFRHQDGGSGQRYLPEHMGSGLCTFDMDADGYLDVYLLNASALPGTQLATLPTNQLFRNRQSFRFSDVTDQAGLTDQDYSLGVTAADYDDDGFVDLYISNFGPNRLLRNNGDGTFTDATRTAGVDDGNKFGAGVTFLDANRDGYLDLFVGNYVEFDFQRHHQLAPKAFPYSPGPRDYPPAVDSLYLGVGDGSFQDATKTSGVSVVAGPSMGVVAGDFDDDADTDIFVACDGAPNLLYVNDGKGQFVEEAVIAGVAYDLRGVANGCMGVDIGDVNGDHKQDLLITDYSDQLPELFVSTNIDGVFQDLGRKMQVGTEVFPHVNWGVGLIDFDCDGDRDIFFCNGHLLENAKEVEPLTDYGVFNTVMENLGNSRFRSITQQIGQALQRADSSRGAAFDDLDNDGDVDVVVLNSDAHAQVLENRSSRNNHWMSLQLVCTTGNRGAIGAKVRLDFNGGSQSLQLVNGRGYQSHYGARLHCGLGQATTVSISVEWPNGCRSVLEEIAVDQSLTLVESTDH